MKFVSFLFGTLVGTFLTFGLMPFPRVVWDGQDGFISGATFDCIGIGARNRAQVTVSGILFLTNTYPANLCPGFLRRDFYSPDSWWRVENSSSLDINDSKMLP